jgi:hypothetical protein
VRTPKIAGILALGGTINMVHEPGYLLKQHLEMEEIFNNKDDQYL